MFFKVRELIANSDGFKHKLSDSTVQAFHRFTILDPYIRKLQIGAKENTESRTVPAG